MPKIHPIFASSLVMMTLIIGVVLAVQYGAIPGADIYLEMKVGTPHKQGDKTKLPLSLTLKNPSGDVQYLEPQDVCLTLRWFVLDRGQAFVQSSQKGPNCIEGDINRGLKPWEEVEESINLALHSKRLQAGEDYFLFLKFWGLQADARFTAP